MTEYITLKKMRNKANAVRVKGRNKQDYRERMGGMVIPIPMDVFLEEIQGIDHETVARALNKHWRQVHD